MVDTPSLKDRAYQHVRRKLADGTLRPTMKVSLAAIAKEIGTSHIPVREAISQLRSEGYLDHTPSVGFFVRSIGRKEMADLFKVREALEVMAAAEAVERMTEETLVRLEAIFRAMRSPVAGDPGPRSRRLGRTEDPGTDPVGSGLPRHDRPGRRQRRAQPRHLRAAGVRRDLRPRDPRTADEPRLATGEDRPMALSPAPGVSTSRRRPGPTRGRDPHPRGRRRTSWPASTGSNSATKTRIR